jgi:hypothetical protein
MYVLLICEAIRWLAQLFDPAQSLWSLFPLYRSSMHPLMSAFGMVALFWDRAYLVSVFGEFEDHAYSS